MPVKHLHAIQKPVRSVLERTAHGASICPTVGGLAADAMHAVPKDAGCSFGVESSAAKLLL